MWVRRKDMFFTGKKICGERLYKFYEYSLIFCILFLALWLRKSLLPFTTYDMGTFYLPWYNFILSHGGFHALKFNFADLNVPYLYLIVIATHFPFTAITNIKLISIAFDVVLAGFTFLIVREKYGQTFVPFLAACIILFLPSIFLNSSFWGECDSSYAALSLGAIYFLSSRCYFWSFVFWGLAISVKLQAIFVFPVLLIVFLSGEVSFLYFFLPFMHDRYFYLADVLSIAYAFYVPKRFYLAIITPLTSFLSYMPFLFGNPIIKLSYVAFAPLLVIVVVVWDLIVDLYLTE